MQAKHSVSEKSCYDGLPIVTSSCGHTIKETPRNERITNKSKPSSAYTCIVIGYIVFITFWIGWILFCGEDIVKTFEIVASSIRSDTAKYE